MPVPTFERHSFPLSFARPRRRASITLRIVVRFAGQYVANRVLEALRVHLSCSPNAARRTPENRRPRCRWSRALHCDCGRCRHRRGAQCQAFRDGHALRPARGHLGSRRPASLSCHAGQRTPRRSHLWQAVNPRRAGLNAGMASSHPRKPTDRNFPPRSETYGLRCQ